MAKIHVKMQILANIGAKEMNRSSNAMKRKHKMKKCLDVSLKFINLINYSSTPDRSVR